MVGEPSPTCRPVDASSGPHYGGDPPWRRDVADVVAALGTDLNRGLSPEQVAVRRARDGPNRLAEDTDVPAWHLLVRQLADPLVYLLLGAVVVSLAGWVLEGAGSVPFEAIVIVVIVVLNAALGVVQEARAERAVAALSRMAAPTAGVVRDGGTRRVPADEVVTGDVLVLAEGAAVPADARRAGSRG
jgi:magnesium-transporting ATPase (P-type)